MKEEQFEKIVKDDLQNFMQIVSNKTFDSKEFLDALDKLYNSLGFLYQEVCHV